MISGETIAHYPAAFDRLLEQWRTKENFLGVLRTACFGVQELEDCINYAFSARDLADAVGPMLDWWGRMLGENRAGMTDAQFRGFLYIKIAALNSQGTPEELISLFKSLMNCEQVIFLETGGASCSLQAVNAVPIVSLDYVRATLERAKPSGVALELSFANDPAFGFGPLDLGFGDETDPSVGGQLASIF